MSLSPASDWAPYRLEAGPDRLCRWFSRAGRRYEEPFFAETVLRCQSEKPNGHAYPSLSSLDFLQFAASQTDAVAPSAFLFHVSRCGSTLLAQLLGLDARHIVLSEVPLFDQLLRAPLARCMRSEEATGALRAAITLLGERRFGETRLFVKLDSWHIHYAGLLRELYPDTPFILMARAPSEVLRSQRMRRGTHAVPGLLEAQLFGLRQDDVLHDDFDIYLGRVLAYYYTQFAQLTHDPRNLLLDYREAPEAMMRRLAQHLGMQIDAALWEAIEERCRFHSKRPGEAYDAVQGEHTLHPGMEKAEAAYRRLGL